MIEKLLENYGGRFVAGLTTYDQNSFSPTYQIFDRSTGETFKIKIDSFNADISTVLKNILDEKITESRDKKINSIIDGD